MFLGMKTTVRRNEELLRRAQKRATAEGRTLPALIEDGLTLILSPPKSGHRKRIHLPVSTASGGVLPGVDLNRCGDLEEILDTP
jgi:hypothetical protein